MYNITNLQLTVRLTGQWKMASLRRRYCHNQNKAASESCVEIKHHTKPDHYDDALLQFTNLWQQQHTFVMRDVSPIFECLNVCSSWERDPFYAVLPEVSSISSPLKRSSWGEFFLIRFEGLRTEDAVRCTDCKAPRGKL